MKIDHKGNIFDLIRIILSSLVVFSHSFPLLREDEILMKITQNQISFGGLAVEIFFAISGYFIFLSLTKDSNFISFFVKRVLRIFPGLFFMLLFTLIVIFFLYYNQKIYLDRSFQTYLFRNLSLFGIQFKINNVFVLNPNSQVINGSVWSLPYEFFVYIIMFIIFKSINRKGIYATFITVFVLFCLYNMKVISYKFKFLGLDLFQLVRLSSYFFMGAILQTLDLKKINKMWTIFLLIFFSFLLVKIKLIIYFGPLIFPLLVILIGSLSSKRLNHFTNKIGDISYGIYIYGFFIQQLIIYCLKVDNPYLLTLYSIPIIYFLSLISWHIIEKKSKNLHYNILKIFI